MNFIIYIKLPFIENHPQHCSSIRLEMTLTWKSMLHFHSMYYLGNKFIVSENKAYLPFESSDLYKFGHFRNLHRISVHLPPSSLFYLFPFRNGKQKKVTTLWHGKNEQWSDGGRVVWQWPSMTSILVGALQLLPYHLESYALPLAWQK